MSHPEFLIGNTGNSRKNGDDGRPRGATQPNHPTPVPTMSRCRFSSYIVGTGAVRLGLTFTHNVDCEYIEEKSIARESAVHSGKSLEARCHAEHA